MMRRIVLAGFLALGHCLPAAAQPGVPVRDTSTIGIWEQLDIAVRRVLVPWAMDVAPLHAYDPDSLICGDPARGERLAAHRGTAALVFAWGGGNGDDGNFTASYHRTVDEAVRAAERMCEHTRPPGSEGGVTDWYFATTYPLPDTTATRHFMSRDVEGIDETLTSETLAVAEPPGP